MANRDPALERAERDISYCPDYTVEDLWAEVLRTAVCLNGRWFDSINSQGFYGAKFIKPGLWRTRYPEELEGINDQKRRGLWRKDIMMARARANKQVLNELTGLEEPFPASPSRLPRYGIYYDRGDNEYRYTNFYALYAAHKWLIVAIDDRPIKWLDNDTIAVGDFRLKSAQMEEIIEYEPSEKEALWELPIPTVYQADYVAGRTTITPPQAETPDQGAAQAKATRKRLRRSRRRDTDKLRRKKSAEGVVTIADLAAEQSLTAREARAILRRAKIKKPAGGWSWPDGDGALDNIRTQLTRAKI